MNPVSTTSLKKSLVVLAAALLLPCAALAKTPDTSYGYISNVFDKLQAHWEEQAYANNLGENILTFTLDENGELHSSGLNADANTDSGRAILAYLKKNAPFGQFPEGMEGNQLQFRFKLSAGSLQMLSYQLLPKSSRDPVIAFASPVPNQPQPVSLFYTRVGAPGRVVESASRQTTDEQQMADYVDQVRQQVKDNWKLPQDYVFQRIIAVLMIDRDGTLLGSNLKQSSGDKVVDKAALQAINTAGVFPKAPANVPSLPVTIEYIFDPILSSAE